MEGFWNFSSYSTIIVSLSGAHLAQMTQLHDLDVIRSELHDALLVFYGDQLPNGVAVLSRDHLERVKVV